MKNKYTGIDSTYIERRTKLLLGNKKYRKKIYNSLQEYIDFLETLVIEEKNDYEVSLIKKSIKKLKKLQKKYYDPCILTMQLPSKNYETEKGKSLIKRMFTKNI